jgi:hypothetical protein
VHGIASREARLLTTLGEPRAGLLDALYDARSFAAPGT